jgi:hypothetical protein
LRREAKFAETGSGGIRADGASEGRRKGAVRVALSFANDDGARDRHLPRLTQRTAAYDQAHSSFDHSARGAVSHER